MTTIHVCSFHTASGSGIVNGRRYFWNYSDRFGPLFTDAAGRELKRQPINVRSNHWKAFLEWHAELLAERAGLREPP